MSRKLILKTVVLFKCYSLLLFLLVSNNIGLAVNRTTPQKDIDSLQHLVKQCNTDTCRFDILMTYFWQYTNEDIYRARPVGEWAYREIKHSENLRALSDGYDIKGFLLEYDKKYDSAYILFQKALKISRKINYYPRIGWSYYHLALINEARGSTDSALYYLKTLLNFDHEVGYHDSECDVLAETGGIFQRNDLPDSALHYYNKALKLSREIQDTEKEIRVNFNIASFYNSQNDTKNELRYLNDALQLAESTKNNNAVVKIYYRIGNIFFKQKRNYDLALNYYQKVLDNCRSQNNHTEASILNDIGKLYIEKGNDSLAMTYILKSLKISRELNFKHQISESYKNLGTIYKHQGKLTKAINSFESCYTTGCDRCPQITFHSSLIDIADSYLKLGNQEKALEYYIKSLELARKFKGNKELALSNLKMGNYYSSINKKSSERYYNKAIGFAGKSRDIYVQKVVADTLSSFFSNKHDYKTAYKYKKLAMAMKDSIYRIESQASMANWELRFEFKKIQNENETKNAISLAEIKRQKAYRNSLFIISLLLIGFGFVVYISYRRKRKANRLLNVQKQQIEEKNREIRASVEEITSQKNEIERISSELHESDEMKLRFFSNISHEFRTPLTLILNPVQRLLETDGNNVENRKQLEIISKNAQKLLDLTNQIMDLQKLDAGKLELKSEKTDIVDYCLGIVSSFESLCQKKNNIIRFTANYRVITADLDKDKIGKIIINLLSNAFKFCFEDSVIKVKIKLLKSRIDISVTDKGIGIPEELVDSVFKRYYQVSSNNRTDGTGIGLAYVKELAGFMKGSVTIDTKVDEGTRISVSIPVNEVEIVDTTACEIEIPKNGKRFSPKIFDTSEFSEENLNENSVLLVEDNDELRDFITDLLKSDFKVYTAKDGLEGIQAAFDHIPNIIISDIMMPGANGITLCDTLKKDERTSHIPVILLTAKDGSQSSYEGYKTGADDYIIKPFDNALFRMKIKNITATGESVRKKFYSGVYAHINGDSFADIDRNFLRKCTKIIEQNIHNPEFSVEQLAAGLAFSRSNLYRKIQSLTGFNPAELIRNIRMQYAEKLLKTTKMRVYEVAVEVGYDNTTKFSQAFRKHYGILPSEV